MENKASVQKDFTLRGMVWGVIVGLVMMALLAYMHALLGLDFNVSPVSIVLGILLVPAIGGATNVYEVTMMQTTASAVATIIPALTTCYLASMWMGQEFNFLVATSIMLLSCVIGVCLVTILRKQFLDDPKLAFPQSVLCKTALDNVGQMKGKQASILYLFTAIGAVVVLGQNVLRVIPMMIDITKHLPEGMVMGIMLMPMLIGLGYVIGRAACTYLLVGSLISNLVLAPIGTRLGWYTAPSINYGEMQTFNIPILVGMSLVAVLIPLCKQWRALRNAFRFDTRASRESEKEFSLKWCFISIIVCIIGLIAIFWVHYGTNPLIMSVLMLICLLFSIICFRVLSETGLSAAFALTIFLIAIAWMITKDAVVALMVAFVMCCIGFLAQNTMMDLKTGQLVGASARKQVWAQFVGIVPGAVVGAAFFHLLLRIYGLDSDYATFPIGRMFYSIAAGISGEDTSGVFHMGRLLLGGGVGAILTFANIPATILGLSLFLAPQSVTGIALGGFIRWLVTAKLGTERAQVFGNAPVGLIIGDTLVNIGIAAFTFFSM